MSRSPGVAVDGAPAPSTGGAVLEIDGLTAGYGATTVLRDVRIVVPSGRVVALIGPNGAGKTTALKAAAGLVTPTAGTIRLGGVDVTGMDTSQRARRGLCLIPEGRGVFPSLTVRDNLVMQSPKGAVATTLDRAASAFPVLGQRLNQIAGTLSGGEQQMLALSRAYVSDPRVVLVDEASLGLSPVVVDRIFEFLTRLAKEGVSLLLVEQYVTRALTLADDVHLINQGRIVYSGAAADLAGQESRIFEQYVGIASADA